MPNNLSYRGSIFISYRRKDSPGYVSGLMSELRNIYGSNQIFLDKEDIKAGSDFPNIIENAVSNCELLLAIIGTGWNEVRNGLGLPRIAEPGDFVRLEISAALQRKIPVIPVLVENTKMPDASELPDELKSLSTLQAIVLTHERWEDDIVRLIAAIENITVEPKISRHYSGALHKLNLGNWQEALTDFEDIASVKPRYPDVQEKIAPLRVLANNLASLGPKAYGWQNFAARNPLFLMVIVSLLPNASAAIFNYLFNLEVIVHPMVRRGVTHAENYFQIWAGFVNSIGFLAGIVLFIFFARPVYTGISDAVKGKAIPHETFASLRVRCLLLGQYVGLISACLWIVAGPIYPLMIGALEFRDYVYFIASLTICGVFVSTYPFFVVTWLCTHVFYLTFISPGSITSEDDATLTRIDSLRWRYLILAGALPMLVLALGLVLGSSIGSRWSTILLGIFGFVGVAGFILAMWLFQAIQADIVLLKDAVRAYSAKPDNQKSYLA